MYRQYLLELRDRGAGRSARSRHTRSRRDIRSRRRQRSESPGENEHVQNDTDKETTVEREKTKELDEATDDTKHHILKKLPIGKKKKDVSKDLLKKLSSVRPRTSHRQRTRFLGHPKLTATQKVLQGDVSVECPSTARIVRIFTSSTFTDTRHERNALMERVYPALKEVCQQQGYEFQVVDMRWGIRDEATDDHMATELCLREVDLCKKLSTGPYFVTFLSHKYGYRDIPNKIAATEYETLVEGIEEDIKLLLNTWFKRDDNAVPSTYVLQSISSVIPDFRCDDEDKRKVAKTSWYEQSAKMQEALVVAAKEKLDKDKAHRYLISVTEAEITRGIIDSEDIPFNCLWFHRRIGDIDKQLPSFLLSRYKECTGDESKVKESQELLRDLRDNRLPKLLAPGHHKSYTITWTENGVDPDNSKEHAAYINKLCDDFQDEVKKMVEIAIEARKMSFLSNPLYAEVVEHTVFCQSKCQAFHGRHETLDFVSKYLKDESTTPLVVHGPSGCGKTSIVAMAAYMALEVFDKKAATVIRFIGTTPDSSTIGALLASVISQIWLIVGKEETDLPADLKELTEIFHETLTLASETEPLVLLLDSLDQFDPAGGARQLAWMPKTLPSHVKLIVSTLPEAQYESFPALMELYTNKDNFLEVPKLDDEDVNGILNKWLEISKRTLLDSQRKVVLDAFDQCPLPLFLKLSFDEACRWSSFHPVSLTTLQTTIRGSINALFSRMEELHGQILVSKSLAYLTLSKSGLTESELEDILSCDDDVLNDVYMYWTPPVRRLPPLLLVRLKADLGQYLVDRGADGVRVFYWYHRQFIEAATDKYCADPEATRKMNMTLADYFAGTWANGKAKPYMDRKGESGSADRKVASQPNKFNTGYNWRKLNNLPHHRIEADELDLLKEECLLNFTFLQEKLHASGLRQILNDFLQARTKYPEDEDIKTVGECLQLSQDALITFPKELPSHLLGRIRNKSSLAGFLEDCKMANDFFLMPDKPILIPPGGQLVHCLADHKDNLTGLDMTRDLKFAVTCSEDKSVKVWDIMNGSLIRSIDKVGKDPEKVLLCCNDSVVLVHTDNCLQGYKLASGVKLYKIRYEETRRGFCPVGVNNDIICTFTPESAVLYSAKTGKLIEEVKCDLLKKNQELSDYAPCAGSPHYAVTTDNDNYNVYIFDVDNKKFIHKKEIFPKFKDKDGDDDQYTVDAMIFSKSGDKLYISNMYTNNLHVYNTNTMHEEKVIPGDEKDSVEKFRLTGDGTKLYFANTDKVVMWDLNTEERSTLLHQPINITDVVMMDMTKAVSIGDDNVVRIYDLTRGARDESALEEEEEQEYQKLFEEEDDETAAEDAKKSGDTKKPQRIKISKVKTLSNPRYILVKLSRSPQCFLQIWDLSMNKIIRHLRLDATPYRIIVLPDSEHLLGEINRKIKKVHLPSGEVTTFQGQLASSSYFVQTNDGTELVAPSRGRMNLKIYSIKTGKIVSVMKTDNKRRYDDLRATMKGRVVIGGTDSGPLYVFDAVARTCLQSITQADVGLDSDLYVNDALLTSDDAYLVFQGSKIPSQAKEGDSSEYIMFSWDLKNKCLKKELVDYEYYRKYADNDDIDTDTAVDVFALLDDRTVVANHNDSYIRVFDITTGEILKKVNGHQSCNLHTVPESPYFLSHGMYSEDNNFRLMDKKTCNTVATFSPDFDINEVRLTSDGHHVVGFSSDYQHPVLWKLMGGRNKQDGGPSPRSLDTYPNIYGDEIVKSRVNLKREEDNEDDPNDPDTDVDEPDDVTEEGTDIGKDLDLEESSWGSLSDISGIDDVTDDDDDVGKNDLKTESKSKFPDKDNNHFTTDNNK